ncbi:MAG: CRISPR-associated protein Cas4, partial [Acidimicrobiia bacterium]
MEEQVFKVGLLPDLIPARMVNEYVYCPRLFYLEWVQGEWAENEDTVAGSIAHRRVDDEAGSLPAPEELSPEDRIRARAILLAAPSLGLIARMDLLEGQNGAVRPVDYKKGAPGPEGPREPERFQLCVQDLFLRENGYRCEEGVLYYATKQRFVVSFDAELVARTLEAIRGLREVAAASIPPPPLADSPKCPRCSLVGICLPDEVSLLRGESLKDVRRLVPARDDAAPLYVLEQGTVVGKSTERLVVRKLSISMVVLRNASSAICEV